MKKIILFSIILSFFACSKRTMVQGFVIDNETKKPIKDANLTLHSTKTTTVADVNGKFCLKNIQFLPNDTIICNKKGYSAKKILLDTVKNRKKLYIPLALQYSEKKEMQDMNETIKRKSKDIHVISDSKFKLSITKKGASMPYDEVYGTEEAKGKIFVFMPFTDSSDSISREPIINFTYFDLPTAFVKNNQDKLFDLLLKEIEEKDPVFELVLRTKKPIKKGIHQGVEATFEAKNEMDIKDGGLFAKCYLFQVGNRIYKFMFINDFVYPSEEEVGAFLNNFELTE
ncbi:MAG: hypothetical protein EAZ95_06525 [Bacteroidetes bacterium]|nr:MAG: hypothetical protein EAZ95_06525 [Bacteroidota bacterium]